MAHLMDKLELMRRSELVRYATEHGILAVRDCIEAKADILVPRL